jgi:rRNA maturation RNase YbeY
MNWEVNFFNENVIYKIRNKGKLRTWIKDVIISEGKTVGEVNFILCDDDYLSKLNFKYLKHRTLTDILTFPLSEDNEKIKGDIYISIPRVRENATKFKTIIDDELHRIMIHGILHMIGYNDSTKQQKKLMREKENFYLGIIRIED